MGCSKVNDTLHELGTVLWGCNMGREIERSRPATDGDKCFDTLAY